MFHLRPLVPTSLTAPKSQLHVALPWSSGDQPSEYYSNPQGYAFPEKQNKARIMWKLVKTLSRSWSAGLSLHLWNQFPPQLLCPAVLHSSRFSLGAIHFYFVVQSLSLVWLFVTLGQQHARLLCPQSSPRVCSNSRPLRRWCCLTISPSAAPFSFCLQSFPASGKPYYEFFFRISATKVVSEEYSIIFKFHPVWATTFQKVNKHWHTLSSRYVANICPDSHLNTNWHPLSAVTFLEKNFSRY